MRILVLVSGKRCSGKDYITEALVEEFAGNAEVSAHRLGLADMCKLGYAQSTPGIDAGRLFTDRAYKEKHRHEMTNWYHREVSKNKWLFQDMAVEKMLEISGQMPSRTIVFIVADTRLKDDVSYFKGGATSSLADHKGFLDLVITLRVHAADSIRCARGWEPDTAKDTDKTETDLDDYDQWNLIISNNSNTDHGQGVRLQLRNRLLPIIADPTKLPVVFLSPIAEHNRILRHVRFYKSFSVNDGPPIFFCDALGVFADPEATTIMIEMMSRTITPDVTHVVGVSSRGYPYAAMLASRYGRKLEFARSSGKTPGPKHAAEVKHKNYGGGILEVSSLSLGPGDVAVVVDDILATGGSLEYAAQAVEATGAKVHSLIAFALFKDCGGKLPGGGKHQLESVYGRSVDAILEYGPTFENCSPRLLADASPKHLDKEHQQDMYDKLAAQYSEDVDEMSEVRSIILKRAFGNLHREASFLDLGCGIGECLRLLHKLGYSDVRGVDFASEMIAAATSKGLQAIKLDFETDALPNDWPKSYDAVFGFAFIHMFPVKRAEHILRKMLQMATKRVFLSTTLHEEDSEGMVPKEMGGVEVVRFRHQFTHESILALAKLCCQDGWRIKWWWMTDPKKKPWIGVLFYNEASGVPDCDEVVKYDLACGAHDVDEAPPAAVPKIPK